MHLYLYISIYTYLFEIICIYTFCFGRSEVSADFFVSNPGKERLFEFIAALTDQPVPGSQARAVHSSGGAAGGVVSESQGFLG